MREQDSQALGWQYRRIQELSAEEDDVYGSGVGWAKSAGDHLMAIMNVTATKGEGGGWSISGQEGVGFFQVANPAEE